MYLIHNWPLLCHSRCMLTFKLRGWGRRGGVSRDFMNLSRDLPSLGWQVSYKFVPFMIVPRIMYVGSYNSR